MTLLEKYQKFLVNNTRPEFEPVSLNLSAEGWKLLIAENLTPLIMEKLQMEQIGDYVWASAYEDGRRRVLSLFKLNDAYATFQWGWNFDFVPRVTLGQKIVWARTDKSIYSHIYELSEDFYSSRYFTEKSKRQARERTIISRFSIDLKDLEKSLVERIEQHRRVFLHLLPYIEEYYESTVSYEGILERIEENMQKEYYCFINSYSLVVYAFIEKRLGMQEKAIRDFEGISFEKDYVKKKLYDIFKSMNKALL